MKSGLSPVAWLVIAIFASSLLIICLVYLYALKIRHDKKRAADKALNDDIFGRVITQPIHN
jgi:hypothetical protein